MEPPILHRDLKTSNCLISLENSDLLLAKIERVVICGLRKKMAISVTDEKIFLKILGSPKFCMNLQLVKPLLVHQGLLPLRSSNKISQSVIRKKPTVKNSFFFFFFTIQISVQFGPTRFYYVKL
jgi:hypothetical protein